MNGSDIVVSMLKKYKVKHIFGLPGDTGVSLYQSLSATENLTHILCRDERHAGYMADAYARVSGTPGVCEVPSGGGFTYVLPAIAEADGSSIPMLSLASDVPLSSDEKSSLTSLDQRAIVSPITRFSSRITDPSMIPAMIRKAFRSATSGQMGPAHLVFPENILSGQAKPQLAEKELYAEVECAVYPAYRTRPESNLVRKALKLILKAQRPVVIAGGGILLSGACAELGRLARSLCLPVATTINGKGSIAETEQLALGVMGANGAKTATNEAVKKADLILAIGTRLNASITDSLGLIGHDAKVIQVDSDPIQLGNTLRAELQIQADARLFLHDLISEALEQPGSEPRFSAWAQFLKNDIDAELQQLETSLGNGSCGYLHPARVVEALDQCLPADSIIVSDAGYSTPYTAAYYRIKAAGRKFIDPRAHGALGYALPASIGAKIAKPEAVVVGLFGDGSLGMNIGELETVTRLNLPIIYIHFNNSSFGWIQNIQKIYYRENYFSTGFDRSVDYVKAAEAFGLKSLRADTLQDLRNALKEAILSERAVFIEVQAPSAAELTPRVSPWLRDEALPDKQRCKAAY